MDTDCALDANGNLKDAADIDFVFSETDTAPPPRTSSNSQCPPASVSDTPFGLFYFSLYI
jgi:hypothetical protein